MCSCLSKNETQIFYCIMCSVYWTFFFNILTFLDEPESHSSGARDWETNGWSRVGKCQSSFETHVLLQTAFFLNYVCLNRMHLCPSVAEKRKAALGVRVGESGAGECHLCDRGQRGEQNLDFFTQCFLWSSVLSQHSSSCGKRMSSAVCSYVHVFFFIGLFCDTLTLLFFLFGAYEIHKTNIVELYTNHSLD